MKSLLHDTITLESEYSCETGEIQRLVARCDFLHSCYKWHSKQEDQVVFPALETRVHNVVRAYSLEHEAEERLFEEFKSQLAAALSETGTRRKAVLKALCCTCEAIQITLQQHLAKEEEQVLPLVGCHFSVTEQAKMFWQLLCSIPVRWVGRVMHWALSSLTPEEHSEMISVIQHEALSEHDAELHQLLHAWLSLEDPGEGAPLCGRLFSDDDIGVDSSTNLTEAAPCRNVGGGLAESWSTPARPPIRGLILVHDIIRKEMKVLVATVQGMLSESKPPTAQRLQELHQLERRLAEVTGSHSNSEDEVLYPVLSRRLEPVALCSLWASEHGEEAALLSALGRSVGQLQRQKQAVQHELLEELCSVCEDLEQKTHAHFLREEVEVIPLLERHFTEGEQHRLLYQSLLAMPLRALEHVLERIGAGHQRDSKEAFMRSVSLAATHSEPTQLAGTLPKLFARWAHRGDRSAAEPGAEKEGANAPPAGFTGDGREGHGVPGGSASPSTLSSKPSAEAREEAASPVPPFAERKLKDDVAVGPSQAPEMERAGQTLRKDDPLRKDRAAKRKREAEGDVGGAGDTERGDVKEADLGSSGGALEWRLRSNAAAQCSDGSPGAGLERGDSGVGPGRAAAPRASRDRDRASNPIDHIFQFHRALRRDMASIVRESRRLQEAHQREAAGGTEEKVEQRLSEEVAAFRGRFQFLMGIYQTHSVAEDRIVFPALEAVEALHNVSHSYTLDHAQESELFADLSQLLTLMTTAEVQVDAVERGRQFARLQGMCTALHSCLTKHLDCEDSELWPLFTSHFSIAAQQQIVGRIVGHSSAELLQAMLPWVTSALSPAEQGHMILSISNASSKTYFNSWLRAWWQGDGSLAMPISDTVDAGTGKPAPCTDSRSADMTKRLVELADYLQDERVGGAKAEASGSEGGASGETCRRGAQRGSVAEGSEEGRPAAEEDLVVSWENVFQLNQSQLEAAVRRVQRDQALEPARKSYLIQNLLTTRWVVAQQRATQAEVPAVSAELAASKSSAEWTGGDQVDGGAGEGSSAAGEGKPQAGAVCKPYRGYHDEGRGILGCKHYPRQCLVVAKCCGVLTSCRLCHDEAVTDGHRMEGHTTEEMVCMMCGARQRCAAQCASCQARMARYFCAICNLFDDSPDRPIYHCPFCNLCRRGKGLGVDMFHCMRCNQCMALSLEGKHNCREGGLETNCPICHENLFTSTSPFRQTPCGHFMHSSCYKEYTRTSYTCPICSKSLADMTIYFSMLDALLEAEQLPEEYASRTQNILCNDCGSTDSARFHFVYHKCQHCSSYNTRVS
ncbi:hypothetical protein CYMTET_42962 [Cymbomonas tetramitiformis]|uniref:Zinc finger protein BRUTUS n=1 Tax=Cymbomonas tetramitiformis TaxID=36881 RepID=A0AAE0C378_9CHLO|nr:hypothetical protein CYMTET_42962 [Cymbomonas tetramitiformis]